MTFSNKLMLLREKKNLSQEQLAEILNVSCETISNWESQRSFPELSKIIALSDLFDVSVDQLIKDDQILFCDEDSCAGSSTLTGGNETPPLAPIQDMMFCTRCGKKNRTDSSFCGYCGSPFASLATEKAGATGATKGDIDLAYYKANLQMQQQALLLQQEELEEMRRQTEQQQMQLDLQKKQYDSMMKCPRCGSTSLSGNKKGYGVGKGIVGAAVFGPLGLVAGNIGAKKVVVTCMKCGHKFKK